MAKRFRVFHHPSEEDVNIGCYADGCHEHEPFEEGWYYRQGVGLWTVEDDYPIGPFKERADAEKHAKHSR